MCFIRECYIPIFRTQFHWLIYQANRYRSKIIFKNRYSVATGEKKVRVSELKKESSLNCRLTLSRFKVVKLKSAVRNVDEKKKRKTESWLRSVERQCRLSERRRKEKGSIEGACSRARRTTAKEPYPDISLIIPWLMRLAGSAALITNYYKRYFCTVVLQWSGRCRRNRRAEPGLAIYDIILHVSTVLHSRIYCIIFISIVAHNTLRTLLRIYLTVYPSS